MTIYDIKRLSSETSPHFFTRKSLKFFGQTMKDFKVYKQSDGRYMITAPMKNTHRNNKVIGQTVRYFNPKNNKLENA
tara:strand:+ start:58837 stop:59067 length:231 start_codon:yes stop_codon:yes gene_type:complete